MSDFTPEELKREHEYRRLEAEGLGRNPERAKSEADAWLARVAECSSLCHSDEPCVITADGVCENKLKKFLQVLAR